MKYAALIAALIPLSLLGFPDGSPVARTGVIDGGSDCSACHKTFAPANSDPRGHVALELLQPYNPGVVQNLRVLVQHPQASKYGFQLTARFVTGNATIQAGSFVTTGPDTKVVCNDGTPNGAPAPCQENQLQWIEHSAAPRVSVGAAKSFEFQWVPPSQENGDIVFYVSAVAADGNDDVQNDWVYTTTMRISLSQEAACPLTRIPQVRSAVNAGSHAGPFSANSMVEIYGSDFQAGSRTRQVQAGDLGSGRFPTMLSCIAVEIDGVRAPVTYVQQDQINVQAPALNKTGPVSLVVFANPGKSNELRSPVATVTVDPIAPSLFTFGATQSVAAQFAGTANVVDDAHPAKPGDYVTLYGTGFGATSPPAQAGEIAAGQARVTGQSTVSIGGITVNASDVPYVGLSPQSISGLYQVNVKIPGGVPDGAAAVMVTINGVATQAGVTIPVRR